MKIIRKILLLAIAVCGCHNAKGEDLKILQLNLWVQGQRVAGGSEAIIDIVDSTDADIVFLCEITGPRQRFLDYLSDELSKRGKYYCNDSLDLSMGILSKFKISSSTPCFRLDDHSRPNPVCKAEIKIGENEIVLYSVHLDWTHYECYMPRGYSGTTWKKIPAPVENADSVLAANRLAFREEGIAALLEDADREISRGRMVILGGDFNEPSHLDWQKDTKDIRDHNGLIIDWDCSTMLMNAGFRDVYREQYPDPVTHPGFTFPAGNIYADISSLTWLPDKDERDRIDFIYYHPNRQLTLKNAWIIGPKDDILYGKTYPSATLDNIIEPAGIWPSDHKGIIATFNISD